ncbi:MAG: cytochrome c oxidase subunit 3 [Chitinophagaceae bacterium]
MMEEIEVDQRNRIHPYKFNLWIALGSIVMMFAGFTSAYIVMHARNTWQSFPLPRIFWFSTAVIMLSSLTMQKALMNFKARNMNRYKRLITLTVFLGLVFLVSQAIGFHELYSKGIKLDWNVSAGLLFIITGLHMLHVLGGVITLLIIFFMAFRRKVHSYDSIPVELAATYWHFVDILWIYLFLFFIWIR